MYTNPFCIRELTSLLTQSKISSSEIRGFQRRAESKINLCLAAQFDITDGISKLSNLTGTIQTVKGSQALIGTSTLFTTELKIGDMVRVNSTGEAFRIEEIIDNTSLLVSFNSTTLEGTPVQNTSLSTFITIPDEIVTATEYETAALVLQKNFSEQSYNQDTKLFFESYQKYSSPIIKRLESGDYYNASLTPQTDEQTLARLVYINNSNDIRTMSDNALDILTSSDFK